MRGLDTNVLLRVLTNDDEAQATVARLRLAENASERFYVTTIALCELLWTLRGRRYGYDRSQLASVAEVILATQAFEVEHRQAVQRAIVRYRNGAADFSDYLLGEIHDAAGCAETWTFDGSLRQEAGFVDLSR